ncbi:MAG TPA: HlyD family secretion protein [Gemmatimonadales bacterium]|nr:HlyD family secretion protein [Gemmatimonadales bacterium]
MTSELDDIETDEPVGPPSRRGRNRVMIGVAAVLVLLALVWGVRTWLYARSHEVTDNAQIEGHVVPVISKVSGFIDRVYISDNQQVREGDTLVVLDRRDLEAKLSQAEADAAAARIAAGGSAVAAVAQARAQAAAAASDTTTAAAAYERAQSDLVRFQRLAQGNVISRQQLEVAEAAARSAGAQLEASRSRALAMDAGIRSAGESGRNAGARLTSAEAAVEAARLQLSYGVITSPGSGRIAKRNAEPGQLVQPGQSLMAVVDDSTVWVVANMKETQLENIRPGQPVEVTVDAYGGHVFNGQVESIQGATGARFALLPPDNATGNFTKVVQRVPVKILLDRSSFGSYVLRPGMSVEVAISTRAKPGK